ncbi:MULTISPECIES: high-potential iron-sulfur protein [unclassified Thioalkalivibrio]|uniref:high-potential iron-sulfur protein n=1 Tax=unclassified Thioalkalivibrio TaxID=2621013 RepID=UPI00035EBF5F|nr:MULTISPECIES: high-potential iron-sulfur protein [unclassified Thioalkalivibrio]
MSDKHNANRRAFLRRASAAVAAIPVVSLMGTQSVHAAEEKAEDGHAHDYVNDAADAADHPQFQEGARCDNCAFWNANADAPDGWGGCFHQDFQNVLVNEAGWCDAHVMS